MGGTLDYESKTLSQEEVERLFHCQPEELCPDMLARNSEQLVIMRYEECREN